MLLRRISPLSPRLWPAIVWLLLVWTGALVVRTLSPPIDIASVTKVDNLDAANEVLARGNLRVGSSTGPKIQTGTGSPNGVVTSPAGSIFIQTDGVPPQSYLNTDGGTTWVKVFESGTFPASFCGAGQAVTFIGSDGGATCGTFFDTAGDHLSSSGSTISLAQIATQRFLGRVTAGTGNVEDLTGTQATTLLDVVTTSAKGLVPTAPNDVTQYLDGTGNWSVPAGGGASFSGASVYSSTNKSITTASLTVIDYDTEQYDTDNYFNSGTSTRWFTVPTDGYYRVGCRVSFATNSTGRRTVQILSNPTVDGSGIATGGTAISVQQLLASQNVSVTVVETTTVVQLTASTTLGCFALQQSGANLNVTGISYGNFQITAVANAAVADGGPTSNVWDYPATADAFDDEFDSTTLNAAWTTTGTWDNVAVDPYTCPAAGHINYQIHTDRRRSWITFQPPADSTTYFLYKSVTTNPNDLFYVRVSESIRLTTSPTNNDGNFGFILGDGSSFTNNVVLKLLETDAGVEQFQFVATGGAAINSKNYFTSSRADMLPIEYLVLHKIGTTVHGWVMDVQGEALYVGSATIGWTPAVLGLFVSNVSSAAPGCNMMSMDFIRRVQNNATWLPGP